MAPELLSLQTEWRFFRNLKMDIPCESVITLLGINQKKMERVHQRYLYPMFREAQFTVSKIINPDIQQLLTVACITMEYSSAIQRDEIFFFCIIMDVFTISEIS